MVSGLPHYAAMPRLDMFANTGFPYTRLADLSQTLVVLPQTPTADESSLYLTMVGFMGAQTGYPALRLEVTQDPEYSKTSDKEILLIGNIATMPHLKGWASNALMQAYGNQFRLGSPRGFEVLTNQFPWSQLRAQRRNLELILQNDSQLDAVVQGFASQVFPERSVIAFTSMPGKTFESMLEDWTSSADASHLYGTVGLFTGGKFQSFTLRPDRYQVGQLELWAAMQYWGRRYYWLSPVLIFGCLWLLTLFCHRWLEARAMLGCRPGRDPGLTATTDEQHVTTN